jgi:hypothetical protein
MALAKAEAVGRSATVALRFEQGPRGIHINVFQDGNRNGVRSRDIDLQIDCPIDAPVALSDLFPGVDIGLTPRIPGTDAVQLAEPTFFRSHPRELRRRALSTFAAAMGTQWVVRVLGVTARTRVLRYLPATGEWVNAS